MANWNYIKVFEDGTQVSTDVQPVFGETSTTADYYLDNVWYNSSGVAYTTTFTYLPYKVLIDTESNVLDYDTFNIPTLTEKSIKVDSIDASLYQGKQVCTAWCNFDGTSTPPAIRDSYNVSQVIRTGTGIYKVYFEEPMDNIYYVVSGSEESRYQYITKGDAINTVDYFNIHLKDYNGNTSNNPVGVQVFGGKQ